MNHRPVLVIEARRDNNQSGLLMACDQWPRPDRQAFVSDGQLGTLRIRAKNLAEVLDIELIDTTRSK